MTRMPLDSSYQCFSRSLICSCLQQGLDGFSDRCLFDQLPLATEAVPQPMGAVLKTVKALHHKVPVFQMSDLLLALRMMAQESES